ncbi:Hypothetical protein PHPALM_15502 [Phytophthora palmivora]|uniref:Uncharacterized protein n=1 Tax=Phytophthora palmivora TaxID=4796 RepID=A0A2P4XS61_9STRA|nr:Hypothetical protein PHPALM_15502 [Phytophthora palmivora]
MFLCARDASARPQDASDDAYVVLHSSDDAPTSAQRTESALPRGTALYTPPFLHPQDSTDSTAYLKFLDSLTRLLAQLLDVHALSPALQFSVGEMVAVDAVEWWKEVQKKSIAVVQRQESTAAAQETFEDLPEDILKDNAADFFVQALYLIMKTLENVNKRQQGQIQGEDLVKVLASVDEGVAFAAAELLQCWAPVSQKMVVDSAEKLSKLMGVVVVNMMLQPRNVGTRHTFHEHALLPSLPLHYDQG